jgi:hypothetical protein
VIYILIGSSCFILPIVVVTALLVIRQGREFSTPWFKFGPKEKLQESQPVGAFIIPAISAITEEQLNEKIRIAVRETANGFKSEVKNQPPSQLFQPPKLSDREIYIHAVLKEIKNKLAGIVINWGGPWAGVSLADLENFLSKAESHNLIPDYLASDIKNFLANANMLIVSVSISDESFLEMQYLAAKINLGLDEAATIVHKEKGWVEIG